MPRLLLVFCIINPNSVMAQKCDNSGMLSHWPHGQAGRPDTQFRLEVVIYLGAKAFLRNERLLACRESRSGCIRPGGCGCSRKAWKEPSCRSSAVV